MDLFQYYIIIGLCICFFIIGSFGNTISIIIFTRKEFIKQPTTVYLIVSNIINIMSVFYLPFMVMPEIWIKLIDGTIGCQIFGGFMIIFGELQPWVYSICSLDRCITTMAPLKFSFKNKLKFQLTLVFICIIVLILLCCPFIFYLREYQLDYANKTVCLFPQSLELNWVITYFKYQFGLFRTALPFIITITASSFTLYILCSSKLKLKKNDWKKMRREFQFARTLITMDILFVLFRIPNTIYTSLHSSVLFAYDFLYSVLVIVGALHNVLTFIIFIIFNKIYLEIFIELIFRKKTKANVLSEP